MTALLDFPTASVLDAPVSAVYAVAGESALVPGTSLRLPVPPEMARIPVAERCSACAGTGVMFDGGHLLAANALMSCGCMELPVAAPDRPRESQHVIEHLGSKTWTGTFRNGMSMPGDYATAYYIEPDYR